MLKTGSLPLRNKTLHVVVSFFWLKAEKIFVDRFFFEIVYDFEENNL